MNIKRMNPGDVFDIDEVQYIVVAQNDEDTLLIRPSLHDYIIAWGLYDNFRWQQGYYISNSKEAFKKYQERECDRNEHYRTYKNMYHNNTEIAQMRLILELGYCDTYDKCCRAEGHLSKKIKTAFENICAALYDFSKLVN